MFTFGPSLKNDGSMLRNLDQPARPKPNDAAPKEVATILDAIEQEDIPSRLLTLAMDLQAALLRRREQSESDPING